MPSRPYFNFTIEDLRTHFRDNIGNAKVLNEIEYELNQRKTTKTSILANDVASAKRALAERQRSGTVTKDEAAWRAIFKGGRPPGASSSALSQEAWSSLSSTNHPPGARARKDANVSSGVAKSEIQRLGVIYDKLRNRLLDMSLRNPMLNYRLSSTSKRQLQFFDEIPEQVYRQLVDKGVSLDIAPLPEPDDIPADERTPEFKAALEHAKVSDQGFLEQVAALAAEGKDSDEGALYKLELELRDRLREKLAMSARPTRKTVSPISHARSVGIDPSPDLKFEPEKPTHSDRKLQCLKWPDVADATLSRISDGARLAEQEMGLSTLFLVFGFLEWYENDESTKPLLAPLLLLPVKLDKRKTTLGKAVHYVASLAEAPETNLSLEKRISADFGRQIPPFTVDEENLGSINSYLKSVGESVQGLKRWRVRPWLLLGHFGFGRLAMYTDLHPDRWPQAPVVNKLIQSILRGTDRPNEGASVALEPPDDYAVEETKFASIAPFLIHDADASQHSALIDALKGDNLVIQGPPGTGKSQTITNLIANAFAAGKRVLFLAEKQAALEVVKRRLDQAGLGEFCLELHSDRASPARVIESLKARHKLGYSTGATSASDHDAGLQRSRNELGAYLQALHNRPDEGKSIFESIWSSIKAETDQGAIHRSLRNLVIPEGMLADAELLNQARDSLRLYNSVKESFETEFGPAVNSPLSRLSFGEDTNQGVFFEIEADLGELKKESQNLWQAASQAQGVGIKLLKDAEEIVSTDEQLPLKFPDPNQIERILKLNVDEVKAAIRKSDELIALEQNVPTNSELRELSDVSLKAILDNYQRLAESRFTGVAYGSLVAEATKAMDRSANLTRTTAATAELLRELDLPDVSGSNLLALLKGIKIIGQQSEQAQDWLAWLTTQNQSSVSEAHARWVELSADMARWRKRFPGCHRFPTIDALTDALAHLEKNLVGRATSLLSNSAATAKAVVSALGAIGGSSISAIEVRNLRDHLLAVRDFENDAEFRRLFGTSWSGLRTPLDYVHDVSLVRKSLIELFRGADGGNTIFARIDGLSASQLRRVVDVARDASTLDFHLLGELGERSISDVTGQAAVDARHARILLDPSFPKILRENQPFRIVADLAHCETRRRQANHELSTSSAYQRDAQLFSGNQSHEAKEALNWIEIVERAHAAQSVSSLVLSLRSQDDRRLLVGAAANWLRSDRAVKARIEKIEADYQVKGFDDFSMENLEEFLKRTLDAPDHLRSYLNLQSYRREVTKLGLDELVASLDGVLDSSHKYEELFNAVIAWKRASRGRRADKVLSRVSGSGLEAIRRDFVERDRKKIAADRLVVAKKLIGNRPPAGSSIGPKKTWTGMALLKREFEKERRFVPVRDLVGRAGSAVQALKPCFMMSPLSLAKFLPAAKLDFDLLIVDEASQMRPEDSLGAIMRVKQLVVVGDQKQLPPTDFFYRSEEVFEEDDESDDIDDESILEACQKTFGQMRMLRWHYRSRCESLIAFSNREFYSNGLITFPSSNPIGFSIDLIRVNGTYGAGTNPDEAQRIAEEAIGIMRHYSEYDLTDIPTLGLVAVNSKQRDLIFEELRQREIGDEKVEAYRDKVKARGEPVFVKNLENVQGDERDFILISLTYGREKGQNVVAQRFGPIGGRQGHRRLNVLFSRARTRIGLFTSMGSEDVRPIGSSPEGVNVLRRYLEYAEKKGKGEYQTVGGEFESEFEVEVAGRLRARGYEVETQIGVSGYRIDLAIRDPDFPSEFVVGIECDGAQYHSSKSARDRDRLREEILTRLGWCILRIWSPDWFDNPSRETDKICDKIEAAKKARERERRVDYVIRSVPNGDLKEVAIEPRTDQGVLDLLSDDAVQSPIYSKASQGSNIETPSASCASLLRKYRDTVVAREVADWEPQRSLLRDGMIETLIAQRLDDPEDWFSKVPLFQRTGTNPIEKEKYLAEVCEIIDRNLSPLH